MMKRKHEYDALRALSIVLLLALHSEVFGLTVYGLPLGPIAAYIGAFLLGSFFFLAGFFEHASMQKYKERPADLIRAKFFRIFPPYWTALAAFVFYMGFSLKYFDGLVYALNLQFLFSPVFAKQLLTLWYISVVFAYFVIFGILNYLASSHRRLLAGVVIIFSVTFTIHKATGLFDPRFFQYFFIFLAGMYFARLDQVRATLLALRPEYKLLSAALGLFVFYGVQKAGLETPALLYILAVNVFILTWVLLFLSIFRTRIGAWRIWDYLATASYFAYLFHRPLWQFFLTYFPVASAREEALFKFLPGSILVLLVSYFLQRTYDLVLTKLKPG